MRVSTIRPGLLVHLSVRVVGNNVSYFKRDIEADHIDEDGAERARWETERTVVDPAEHETARKLAGACSGTIRKVCAWGNNFGLLCPEDREKQLDEAIATAQEMAAEFNAKSKLDKVVIYTVIGRVAQDDVQAVRSINNELRELITDMESGLKNLDADAVRDAATRAKKASAMLSPEANERVAKAIEVARAAARKIVKAGEQAEVEIDKATLDTLRTSRTAFLDLDEGKEVAAPTVTGRALDLAAAEPLPLAAASGAPRAPALDL